MATARFAVMVALAMYLRHRTSSTGDEAPSMARSRRTECVFQTDPPGGRAGAFRILLFGYP
eukprot:scaffold22700_cov52-Cyclotella_meneghiniana.AAC.9